MRRIFKKFPDKNREGRTGVKMKIVIYTFFIIAILFTVQFLTAQNEDSLEEEAPVETESEETVESETAETGEETETTEGFTLLEMFEMGGIFMWPLLAFSVATLSIGLERLIFLLYHKLKTDDLKIKVCEYVENGDYQGAIDFLKPLTQKRIGARVLLATVNKAILYQNKEKAAFSESHIEKAAETEAMICINSLERGFNYLVALGSLSPLTGFLGTVSGMIGAFRSIANATEVNAQIVANGIYESLITTVCGLVIAIFAMVFHSVFTSIVDKFASETEKNCSELIANIADRHI